MTGTDFCVNKPHMSRSYLNHLVHYPSDISYLLAKRQVSMATPVSSFMNKNLSSSPPMLCLLPHTHLISINFPPSTDVINNSTCSETVHRPSCDSETWNFRGS